MLRIPSFVGLGRHPGFASFQGWAAELEILQLPEIIYSRFSPSLIKIIMKFCGLDQRTKTAWLLYWTISDQSITAAFKYCQVERSLYHNNPGILHPHIAQREYEPAGTGSAACPK